MHQGDSCKYEISSISRSINFKVLSAPYKGLKTLEDEFRVAQRSFTDCVLESTATFNVLKLKLVQLRKKSDKLNYKLKQYREPYEINNNDSYLLETDDTIQIMQEKLRENTSKQTVSIKRSMMKLTNLVAQFELTNKPYYELKEYANQLSEYQRAHDKPRRTYLEVLDELEKILHDVENVEIKTTDYLGKSTSDQESSFSELCSLYVDEYKDVSLQPITTQFSTT